MEKSYSRICTYIRIYIYIYIHTHIWKAFYQNTIFEFSIGIASSFYGMALNAFWKRALQLILLLQMYRILNRLRDSQVTNPFRLWDLTSMYSFINLPPGKEKCLTVHLHQPKFWNKRWHYCSLSAKESWKRVDAKM